MHIEGIISGTTHIMQHNICKKVLQKAYWFLLENSFYCGSLQIIIVVFFRFFLAKCKETDAINANGSRSVKIYIL